MRAFLFMLHWLYCYDRLYLINERLCLVKKNKPVIGRPTIYTDDLARQICARIASGESIRRICKDESMPVMSTIMLWLIDGNHQFFSEHYAQARQIQAETLADEIFDIADDGSNDFTSFTNGDGEAAYKINGEAVARSRLRVDTRKWYLSKVLPRFADKKEDVGGAEVLAAAINKLIEGLPD